MYTIAYCDDNALGHGIFRSIFDSYAAERNLKAEISYFSGGAKLLEAVKAGKSFNIYFLDLIMPEVTGMEAAKELRRLKDPGLIIFLSSNKDYLLESYEVRSFFYLIKPVDRTKLEAVLDDAFSELSKNQEGIIILKTPGGDVSFKYGDVLYICRAERALEYGLYGGAAHQGLKLRSSFEEAVSDVLDIHGFVIIGTVVINMSQVESVGRNSLVFKDGSEFYPPASNMKCIREKIKEFWEKEFSGKVTHK